MVPRLFIIAVSTLACDVETPEQVQAQLSGMPEEAKAPSGTLELADTKQLVYAILGTQRVYEAIALAAGALPGVRQSPVFKRPADAEPCTKGDLRKLEIDYKCLGATSGRLRMLAHGRYPNDNGDYELSLDKVSMVGEPSFSGNILIRVQGLGDDDVKDEVLFSIRGDFGGVPQSYGTFDERQGLVANVEHAGGPMYGLARIADQSFVFQDVALIDSHLLYAVRDRKNLWHCDSIVDGQQVGESTCRVPEGTGDWAILRF